MDGPLTAFACPRCAIGAEARQAFWNEQPAFYSAALLAPFVLALLIAVLLSRLGSKLP